MVVLNALRVFSPYQKLNLGYFLRNCAAFLIYLGYKPPKFSGNPAASAPKKNDNVSTLLKRKKYVLLKFIK